MSYSGAEEAISNISFVVKRGETVGVIGGTGSGKSTLVNLIPRFYDVTKGQILVNGENVKNYKIETLRKKIGVVPQKAVLFRGTIRDNMKMGNENATDEMIYRALETAQALEVVEKKKEGLDAKISQNGKNLSGGQKQRLTIARALVKNPEILILDDSASALDFATDARLRKAIAENTDQMTVFIVSQRASSINNLLMRFYDIDAGKIYVSGHDVKEITKDSLRANFGMVLQDTWLKSGTIAENIAYGKPEATRAEIIEAAKAAHAHGFIKRMSDGYDTVISEDGGNLSQGQKQLLCIARVMLKLPPILILDEATSSIDTRTEIKIQEAFQKMMEGRTSFIVAHRLSTIKEADIILVMKDGNIVEQGNHEELLARNGFYAKLYQSQFA